MSANNPERMPQIVSIPIGTQAASIVLPGAYFRKRSRLKAARIIDQAGVSASNSNYLTMTLESLAANPTVYASHDSRSANQGALVANTPALMTLGGGTVLGAASGAVAGTVLGDSTNPEVDVPAGESMVLRLAATGTVTSTKAVLQLELYPL